MQVSPIAILIGIAAGAAISKFWLHLNPAPSLILAGLVVLFWLARAIARA